VEVRDRTAAEAKLRRGLTTTGEHAEHGVIAMHTNLSERS